MQPAGRSPKAINRELAVLRHAFWLGYQHDLIRRMPAVQTLPALGRRQGFFSPEEVTALLDQ